MYVIWVIGVSKREEKNGIERKQEIDTICHKQLWNVLRMDDTGILK